MIQYPSIPEENRYPEGALTESQKFFLFEAFKDFCVAGYSGKDIQIYFDWLRNEDMNTEIEDVFPGRDSEYLTTFVMHTRHLWEQEIPHELDIEVYMNTKESENPLGMDTYTFAGVSKVIGELKDLNLEQEDIVHFFDFIFGHTKVLFSPKDEWTDEQEKQYLYAVQVMERIVQPLRDINFEILYFLDEHAVYIKEKRKRLHAEMEQNEKDWEKMKKDINLLLLHSQSGLTGTGLNTKLGPTTSIAPKDMGVVFDMVVHRRPFEEQDKAFGEVFSNDDDFVRGIVDDTMKFFALKKLYQILSRNRNALPDKDDFFDEILEFDPYEYDKIEAKNKKNLIQRLEERGINDENIVLHYEKMFEDHDLGEDDKDMLRNFIFEPQIGVLVFTFQMEDGSFLCAPFDNRPEFFNRPYHESLMLLYSRWKERLNGFMNATFINLDVYLGKTWKDIKGKHLGEEGED